MMLAIITRDTGVPRSKLVSRVIRAGKILVVRFGVLCPGLYVQVLPLSCEQQASSLLIWVITVDQLRYGAGKLQVE
jgi:hypothetical protein